MKYTEDYLSDLYGYWNEHPIYTWSDWKYQVENSQTRQSYWSWVADQYTQSENENTSNS